MVMSTRNDLVEQLNGLLRLTQTETMIAETRRAQAATPDVERELAANADKSRERTQLLSAAIRDLKRTEEEATERGATRTARNVNRTRRDLGAIDGDELPIRNYDSLTATSAIERIERLRDVDDLRAVLAYEAANKARKGVTNAIEGRLEQLVAELAAAS